MKKHTHINSSQKLAWIIVAYFMEVYLAGYWRLRLDPVVHQAAQAFSVLCLGL